jgi:Icc-related predicted phosphoesterase|tara:strand:- start:533 stop:1303 length:771 start_codon:yes stop_codon:yes gene_type:complete
MLFISDVHHGLVSLKNLPNTKEPIVILGDLINWIDYRNGEGIAQDVFGKDIVVRLIQLRKDHNFEERKKLWSSMFEKDKEEVQLKLEQAIYRQYQEVFKTLKNYEVLIIPGNVDSEKIIKETMTNNVNYVDGKVINYKHFKIGFAGGGVPTPINARGEISEEVFSLKLKQLGEVDIICTHAPPYVKELITDVITNKKEQGWESLKDYILEKKPKYSIFGDVHQPQASKWRLGTTDCLNVGYFRANSNYLELASLIA